MTSMPHLATMIWGFKDELERTDLGGGGTAYYVYDSAGQRTRKVIETQNGIRRKERLYLGGFEIYREYGSNGLSVTLERESLHVMDDKQRIALVETQVTQNGNPISAPEPLQRYQFGNHLGSVSVELDQDCALISYEEYYLYGTTSFQANGSVVEVGFKRYRYIGKEQDEETGLGYFGARYYACWLGRWASCDPAAADIGRSSSRETIASSSMASTNSEGHKPPIINNHESLADPKRDAGIIYNSREQPRFETSNNSNAYEYANSNSMKYIDPDGRDAIPVVYPDYKISALGTKWSNLGHAGIILINPKTGETRYYEYGRYDKEKRGETHRRTIPDVVIDKKTGMPTDKSLANLMDAVSRIAGQQTRVEGAYVKDDNFRKMANYAEGRVKESKDPDRKEYGILGNNCGTFAKDVLEAGGKDTPLMIDPRPNSYIDELQEKFGNRISYDPKTKELQQKDR
jgi:RHS repeat-associated protein